jgi:hypothetical protein
MIINNFLLKIKSRRQEVTISTPSRVGGFGIDHQQEQIKFVLIHFKTNLIR